MAVEKEVDGILYWYAEGVAVKTKEPCTAFVFNGTVEGNNMLGFLVLKADEEKTITGSYDHVEVLFKKDSKEAGRKILTRT